MKVQFIGAVGTVTGSKFLVESDTKRILVDCGLFQGVKVVRQRNWRPLPFDSASLDAVVLTHAHLDHSGYLPVLVKQGFKGPIYCTRPTKDLCSILLPDSGHLQEEDARYANKKGFSKHTPALPLYTEDEARQVVGYFKTVDFGETVSIGDLKIDFLPAGHILGAAHVLVLQSEKTLLFSGDIGRPEDLLTPRKTKPGAPHWLLMESTYGDRFHTAIDPITALSDIVKQTISKKGILLIPAFAVGRAQMMLYCLQQIFERSLTRRIPVFLNSPMATNVTELYQQYHEYHNLSKTECAEAFGIAKFVNSVEESKRLNTLKGPAVIISASGMMTGGRILHHLKAFAPFPENTILLTGYQAPGTRGATLASGKRSVKIHGAYVSLKAQVEQIDFLSAHADQQELLNFLTELASPPKKVFLVHGESEAQDTLRLKIEENLNFDVQIPEYLEKLVVE